MTVVLPAVVTSPQRPVTAGVTASTTGEALRAVAAQAPQFAQRLFYKDRLLVGVVLNGRHLVPAEALTTPVAPGDRLEVVPPVAGG